jgi:hypothetical protein
MLCEALFIKKSYKTCIIKYGNNYGNPAVYAFFTRTLARVTL